MDKFPPHPHYQNALRSISLSLRHTGWGEFNIARAHLQNAHSHAAAYSKHLHETKQPEMAKQFESEAHHILSQLKEVIEHGKHFAKSERIGAPKAPGATPSYSSASPLRREINANPNQLRTTMQMSKTPGMDHRYNYKPLHELSPKDQQEAHHAFQGKEMEHHLYPVDKEGKFVRSTRAKMPSHIADNPAKGAIQPPRVNDTSLKPEYRVDSTVSIHAPDQKELHGQRGVVRLPNPNMPGKIRVRIGTGEAYVNPDQVKLHKAESLEELAADARLAVELIREKTQTA